MAWLMVCVVLRAGLAGCGSVGYVDEAPLEVDRADVAADNSARGLSTEKQLEGPFREAPLEGAELRITRNGWINVDCGEEMKASNRLRKSAAKFDATVMSFNDHSVTFKMPSSRLDSLIDVIEGTEGWEIDEFDFSAWDRTGEFYSVEARIESTEAVKARMLKLLESAQTVNEVLDFSHRLEEIQTKLDGFETSIRDIKLHAGRVDVTVNFD